MNNTYNILIVDDEKSNIDIVLNIFKQSKNTNTFNTFAALSGQRALKIINKSKIDLILLDINMPEMDGFEICSKIKQIKEYTHTPIIFITANTDSESITKSFEKGAVDYVSKPFNPKELLVRVNNHLRTSKLISNLEIAYKNLEKFIDMQDSMVILTDGKEIKFANKRFFEFLGYENLEDFKKHHLCISEKFIQEDRFFHTGKIENENDTWIDAITPLSSSQKIVSLLNANSTQFSFSVSINKYDENTLIVSFADISQTILENISLEKKMLIDKLTGAYNREFFNQNYNQIINNCFNSNTILAVAFLDIDHFKSVNDNYGHDVGDKVLIHFVETINKHSRDSDILIRWGGEEFVLLLKINSEEGLNIALENLRKVIQNTSFPSIGTKTCSIGGTIHKSDESIEQSIKRADIAMYEAKKSGRNKVIIK